MLSNCTHAHTFITHTGRESPSSAVFNECPLSLQEVAGTRVCMRPNGINSVEFRL